MGQIFAAFILAGVITGLIYLIIKAVPGYKSLEHRKNRK